MMMMMMMMMILTLYFSVINNTPAWLLPSFIVIYEELLRHHELTEEDCCRPISDKHLELFSLSLCNCWKMLPAFLGITAQDVDLDSGEQEKTRHRFLLSWKQSEGSLATYKKLITSLLELECAQDANEVMLTLKTSPLEEDNSLLPLPSASEGNMAYVGV